MAIIRPFTSKVRIKLSWLSMLGTLVGATGLVFSSGNMTGETKTFNFGADRIVAWETLPEMSGAMCELVPVSATAPLFSASMQGAGSSDSSSRVTGAPPRPGESVRSQVAKRLPVATLKDNNAGFAGITVDPVRNEVIMADENMFSVHVYDRMENTAPTARMSEPKRLIQGEDTFLEFACSVYVDPANGEIYAINNDTLNWMPVFSRDAKGNAKPIRKLETPHTTFSIVGDEEQQELFLTIQDDHAVVVFKKTAKEEDPAVRTLQGPLTLMADPHGIALDPKSDLIYVTNWGSNNSRTMEDDERAARNFPIGRRKTIHSSGKFAPPSITVYPKASKGNTPPLRVIQGPKTLLDWPTSIAIHPDRGEIFIANDTADSVTVFRSDANGDVAPIRVITGSRTMIKNPTGIAVDLKNNELWVANFGSHSATVFPIDANGNVTPKRVIRSALPDAPAPMMGNPHTMAYDTKRDEILVSN
jgi:DNA-binding beta-propeller fold protein YncE